MTTTILVIDDEIELAEEVVFNLSLEGFTVFAASDGYGGLDAARTYRPDLILCDIMLPDLDGYSVLRELQHDNATAFIPFIFMSAKADEDAVRLGMSLGADDYITKPFTFAHLIQAIYARLNRHRTREVAQLRDFTRTLIERYDARRAAQAARYQQHLQGEIRHFMEALRKHPDGASLLPRFTQLVAQLEQLIAMQGSVILPHQNVLEALHTYLSGVTERTGITVDFQSGGIPANLAAPVKDALFHIVRESVDNAVKHAQVERVRVVLWAEQEQIRCVVQDEGAGFEHERIMHERITHEHVSGKKPFGLIEMQQRALNVNGEVQVISSVGEGTLINIILPEQLEDASPVLHPPLTVPPDSLSAYDTLTERERELFHLVVKGMTNAQIAQLLTLSVRTVETHRLNMMRKLGVNSKSDLLVYAIKNNLISIG